MRLSAGILSKSNCSTTKENGWGFISIRSLLPFFVCPTEITAFSDRIQDFRKLNAEVLGCSVDSKFSHLAWVNTPRKEGGLEKIEYPLLADLSKKIAADYGVLLDRK